MRGKNAKSLVKNEKGLATIEVLPLLVIFIIMVGFSYGIFGAIHSGILNSIASRNYAFETFRHRSNLIYFRENQVTPYTFEQRGNRVHRTTSENFDGAVEFPTTERPITVGAILGHENGGWAGRTEDVHNDLVFRTPETMSGRNRRVAVNPIWIMAQYGICLNSACGDAQ
mgnify:CR=1 FL=1